MFLEFGTSQQSNTLENSKLYHEMWDFIVFSIFVDGLMTYYCCSNKSHFLCYLFYTSNDIFRFSYLLCNVCYMSNEILRFCFMYILFLRLTTYYNFVVSHWGQCLIIEDLTSKTTWGLADATRWRLPFPYFNFKKYGNIVGNYREL